MSAGLTDVDATASSCGNDPTPGVPRRSTAEILERLQQFRGYRPANYLWYEPGKDVGFYAPAKRACLRSADQVKKLGLTDEELNLLTATNGLAPVIERITSAQEAAENSKFQSKALRDISDYAVKFCKFTEKFSGVVEVLLPPSPEYTISYGLIMLLFRTVVKKRETDQLLEDFIESLTERLPLLASYSEIFPTNAMKTAVANIYIEVIEFLGYAVNYYHTSRFGKLIDNFATSKTLRFESCISKVTKAADDLKSLTDVANKAQQADMNEMLRDVGEVVSRLYINVENSTNAIGRGLDFLNQQVESLQTASQGMYIFTSYNILLTTFQCTEVIRFQSVIHVQALHDILLPLSDDSEEEFDRAIERETRLSPKDRWENNGVLEPLHRWSTHTRQTLLWIAGRCGNQDTWVTDFSLDVIRAMRSQDIVILYVLCNDSMTGPMTSISIIKKFITQLLCQQPSLIFRHPEICNARIFQQAGAGTIQRVWRIFETLMQDSGVGKTLIAIDRIDQAIDDESTRVEFDLLPRLANMAAKQKEVDVIASSLYAPREKVERELLGGDAEEHARITKIMIDTTIRAFQRSGRTPYAAVLSDTGMSETKDALGNMMRIASLFSRGGRS